MSSDPSSWKEVKAQVAPGPIWNFQRGYRVNEAGRHEDEKAFKAFQFYLHSGNSRNLTDTASYVGSSQATVAKWYDRYNWARRCAAYDKQEMALAFKQASKIQRAEQRRAIQQFRQANEDQAKLMMEVSSDLMDIIQKRIRKAEEEDENIPMGLLSGLMRAASNISDSGRQAWATSLGVNELMQVVDQELVDNATIDEVDVYEIPLDE